jgi:hypothetical protein
MSRHTFVVTPDSGERLPVGATHPVQRLDGSVVTATVVGHAPHGDRVRLVLDVPGGLDRAPQDTRTLTVREHACAPGQHVMLTATTCVCGGWRDDLPAREDSTP